MIILPPDPGKLAQLMVVVARSMSKTKAEQHEMTSIPFLSDNALDSFFSDVTPCSIHPIFAQPSSNALCFSEHAWSDINANNGAATSNRFGSKDGHKSCTAGQNQHACSQCGRDSINEVEIAERAGLPATRGSVIARSTAIVLIQNWQLGLRDLGQLVMWCLRGRSATL
jgi:hypothetical protein